MLGTDILLRGSTCTILIISKRAYLPTRFLHQLYHHWIRAGLFVALSRNRYCQRTIYILYRVRWLVCRTPISRNIVNTFCFPADECSLTSRTTLFMSLACSSITRRSIPSDALLIALFVTTPTLAGWHPTLLCSQLFQRLLWCIYCLSLWTHITESAYTNVIT